MVGITDMMYEWLKTSMDAAEHLPALEKRHLHSWRCLNPIQVIYVNATWKWYYFMEQTQTLVKNCTLSNA